MVYTIRYWLLLPLILQICFIFASQAGVFKDQECLKEACSKAGQLKEKIFPGKIVISSLDGRIWDDFFSATPIGTPEKSKTKTILSSAHNTLLWDVASDWKESKDYKMSYYDFQGREYAIKDAITASSQNMDVINDIALYYLEDYVACNPYNTIERDLSPTLNLRALPNGWGLISSNVPSACNFTGEESHYLQNEFYLNSNNVYAHAYGVDQMVHLSNKAGQHRHSYLSSNLIPTAHQIYAHDSGSSWFKENSIGGYSLTALASEEQAVEESIIRALGKQDDVLGQACFLDDFFTMKIYKLNRRRLAVNLFTPLAPHRDWIYRQIR